MTLETAAKKVKTDVSQKFASCVLIFDANGYILATARKNDPTAFGMPGGKLEIGDDFYQAAIRETQEETGVELSASQLIPVFTAYDGPYEVITFTLSTGALASRPPLAPREGEGICRWITPKDLATGFFPVYNVSLFKVLPDSLRSFYQQQSWLKAVESLDISALTAEDIRHIINNS
ncbi:NUDIX hydrolase [Candidatus Odyssella thessalonicensis]|uniref:NUDIX hydrolase n=1 Tax=Candidatus Odyssella thessalonicensis TaxID=84647 RepID=UPI000225B4CA|nr:NUDIX hydrolase [Candidatus Odyssella thessalonicensis]